MTHNGPPQGQPDPYGQQHLPPQPYGQAYPQQPYPAQQGLPQPYSYQAPVPPWTTKHNWAGITGLVIGIVAFVAAALWPVPSPGFFLGTLAIIFSGVGLTKANIGTASNRSVSGVGMALGLLSLGAALYTAIT